MQEDVLSFKMKAEATRAHGLTYMEEYDIMDRTKLGGQIFMGAL